MDKVREITLKDIEAAIEKVGLDKDLELINKAMALDHEELMKDYKPAILIDVERIKYYAPNGVEITFNSKEDE